MTRKRVVPVGGERQLDANLFNEHIFEAIIILIFLVLKIEYSSLGRVLIVLVVCLLTKTKLVINTCMGRHRIQNCWKFNTIQKGCLVLAVEFSQR